MTPDDIRMKTPAALVVSADVYAAMGSPDTIPVRLDTSAEPGTAIPVTDHNWGILSPSLERLVEKVELANELQAVLRRSERLTAAQLRALAQKVVELK